jgi:FixJ family two-component response regulator
VLGLVHIVDDDVAFLRAMDRLLKQAGYQVATYASGQQLLDQLPSEIVPGCILLDVRLPGLTGPELQAPERPRFNATYHIHDRVS